MYDLIIRGGRIVDGTGAPAYTADVAVKDGRIAEIGKVAGPAARTIEADGAIVTPGFIDVHTHYDGQFLWDDRIDPSFSHGVTTVVGGNCGVGFAPVVPEHRHALIELMEGVEEIPGIVLDEGMDWKWRSFPDYLDRLGARQYAMDVAVHMTHAPLRVFVMGERALRHEAATPEDIAAMAALVREGMDAGAVGFSGARLLEHLSSKGAHVPGTFAEDDELMGLARAMGESGRGTFQIIPMGTVGDVHGFGSSREQRKAEHDRMVAIAKACNRPLTYTLVQFPSDADDWRLMIGESDRAFASGLPIHPQVAARATGVITSLEGYHAFLFRPSYREIAHLPLAERVKAMRDEGRRARILGEADDEAAKANTDPAVVFTVGRLHKRMGEHYLLAPPVDYEPSPDKRVAELAKAAGVSMETLLYDHYAAGDGTNGTVSFLLNFAEGDLSCVHDMLSRPNVISGLGDGGAHMRMICDASLPTFQLAFWTRDRTRGPRFSLEHVVQKLAAAPAALYSLNDRGTIAVGKRADLNVIDYDRVGLDVPRMAHDLPMGSPRLLQDAHGYLATIVKGEVTRLDGQDTGARPGRLVRSTDRLN
jgi:N-acyl-D-aspartate/D-glutamate deacylase